MIGLLDDSPVDCRYVVPDRLSLFPQSPALL
jgi:hypothetical protein